MTIIKLYADENATALRRPHRDSGALRQRGDGRHRYADDGRQLCVAAGVPDVRDGGGEGVRGSSRRTTRCPTQPKVGLNPSPTSTTHLSH